MLSRGIHRQNVGMIQRRHGRRLHAKPLPHLRGHSLRRQQHLQRHLPRRMRGAAAISPSRAKRTPGPHHQGRSGSRPGGERTYAPARGSGHRTLPEQPLPGCRRARSPPRADSSVWWEKPCRRGDSTTATAGRQPATLANADALPLPRKAGRPGNLVALRAHRETLPPSIP